MLKHLSVDAQTQARVQTSHANSDWQCLHIQTFAFTIVHTPGFHASGSERLLFCRFATMEGVLALVRLYQKYTFSLNEHIHGGRPLEHESLITLMPKVSSAVPQLM